jgi:hypothetical protein
MPPRHERDAVAFDAGGHRHAAHRLPHLVKASNGWPITRLRPALIWRDQHCVRRQEPAADGAGVSGEFERGEVVACIGEDGSDIARGLINYNAAEARLIAQHASQEIEALLGYGGEAEIIHRDNLVLL